jgi:hypothetical protein
LQNSLECLLLLLIQQKNQRFLSCFWLALELLVICKIEQLAELFQAPSFLQDLFLQIIEGCLLESDDSLILA